MWDFSIGRTIAIVLRTWPFVLLRIAVYSAITMAYVVATGAGAGVGYGIGHVTGSPDGPPGFAVLGGIFGFGLVSFALYWMREYLLYVLKAGHIAVMVRLIDGQPIPNGQSQIAYGRAVTTARFAEANVLFVMDQLIKGVIGAITVILNTISVLLPIPGLRGLIGFVASVIRLSITYVDEIILGYNIRLDSAEPWETARRGLVLYAQNGRAIIRNALWLAVIMWGLTLIIFLLSLTPATAILYLMPGQLAGWSFVMAIVFAWAFKAAVIEPFAIAALMQVYFRQIEGQTPNPEWDAKLSDVSRQFRDIKDRAIATLRSEADSLARR